MSIQILFANIILLSTVFDVTNAFYLSLHTFKWPNASTYCQSYCNSHLASIHSQEDHLKTVDLINRSDYVYQKAWLGLNDIATTDLWVWSDASDFNFGNITNSTTGKIQRGSYPWQINEPDPDKVSQGVALENGQWIDRTSTSRRYHFLCNDCSGKINKYAIIYGDFTFTEAETTCQDVFGTSLASIHNNDDMTEAVIACKQISKSYGCWIGLNNSDISAPTPQYEWTDHTTWDYGTEFYQYPWYAGTPNKGEPCVFLDPKDKTPGEYLWDDHTCDETIKTLCNAPSEICNSNQWIMIKGDTNKWIWNIKPCEMVKTIIETESIAILANKQHINTAGVLKIDMMYSITSTIIHGNAGIVLYLNNANCDNYYYIGVSPQHSIIFIGKYINNVFDLIASEYLIPAFNLNTQYLLSIELTNGIEWNILFNKQSMIQITDNQFNNQNNLISGYIGIRNVNVQINIKSLYISGQIQYEDNNIWYNQCTNKPTSIDNNPIFTSHPTVDPSASPTLNPTQQTAQPTTTPTQFPSLNPTKFPSQNPTKFPSQNPTKFPSQNPTKFPSENPTKFPSKNPTKFPSGIPTKSPSENPTKSPSENPTKSPSENPTKFPSQNPTKHPSENPTKFPSQNPTKFPSQNPTKFPSETPTKYPTKFPSENPTTETPTKFPSETPTKFPTKSPSENPTKFPSENPTKFPSETPTKFPSENPTKFPSETPTKYPSTDPTNVPTTKPSVSPSTNPTNMPTKTPQIRRISIYRSDEYALVERTGKGMDKTTSDVMITLVIISIIGLAICTGIAFYKKKGKCLKFKRNQTIDELPEVETYND